jgi:hypothetical protein
MFLAGRIETTTFHANIDFSNNWWFRHGLGLDTLLRNYSTTSPTQPEVW